MSANNSYQYPLDLTWTGEEMAAVIPFLIKSRIFMNQKYRVRHF